MPINRVAAQKIIERIPTELRAAARKERKFLLEETKKDPVSASFMAAKGQIPFFNNIVLEQKLAEVNKQIAAESYASAKGPAVVSDVVSSGTEVVKASSIF